MTYLRKQLGASGEDLATNFLEENGYKILQRNKRFKFGEIDILAQDGEFVVLVEVKTKTNLEQGRPEEKVDYFKKRKLIMLAKALEQIYPGRNIRIDVVAVDKTQFNPKINHIENAVEDAQ